MKKIIIGIITIILIIGLVFGGYFVYDKLLKNDEKVEEKTDKKKEIDDNVVSKDEKKEYQISFTIEGYDNGKLIEIDYNEFKELIDAKKSFVILFSQTFCGHCKSFKPILEEFLKDKNYPILYLELDLLEGADRSEFFDFIDIRSTPVLTYIYNGEELDKNLRLKGYNEKEKVQEFITNLLQNNSSSTIVSYKNLTEYPDFIGKKLSDVLDFCDEYDINLETEYSSSKDYELDTVIKQSKPAGTTIMAGAKLKIYLADPRI